MSRPMTALVVVLVVAFSSGLVLVAHAAQKIVAGQCAGGGGGAAGGSRKLVGSIPASAAGRSAGGAYRVTGGFAAAAQVFGIGSLAVESTASSGMVSSLAAAQTAQGGAEIAFSLSAPATVEVRILNIAGRPIRTVVQARECEQGLNAIAWSGVSDQGLRVPAGAYLVIVRAKAPDGAASQVLAPLRMDR